MTMREIADAAGVSVDTASRKAKELFSAKFMQGKKVVLAQREAVEVMKQLRKVNFVELPQNAEALPQSAEAASGSSLTTRDLDLISAIVSRTVSMTIQQLDVRLSKIETRVEERQALLPAPKIADKDAIRQLVAKEAEFSSREHSSVWNELYTACYYRRMGNFKVQARNAGAKSVIDYIDSVGASGDVLAVAVDMWGRA
jgi:DNA-binding Lrp family transcriptional regulator